MKDIIFGFLLMFNCFICVHYIYFGVYLPYKSFKKLSVDMDFYENDVYEEDLENEESC